MKHEIERFGSVSCKHRDLPKHDNWPFFISDNSKKREKFWLAVIGLRAQKRAIARKVVQVLLRGDVVEVDTQNHISI